jgi:polyphosphate kinase 2 (PPK2 family)
VIPAHPTDAYVQASTSHIEERVMGEAKAKMKRKEYETEVRKLHAELVAMQEWIKAAGAKICIVRGSRQRRHGRHDQGDHRTRELG